MQLLVFSWLLVVLVLPTFVVGAPPCRNTDIKVEDGSAFLPIVPDCSASASTNSDISAPNRARDTLKTGPTTTRYATATAIPVTTNDKTKPKRYTPKVNRLEPHNTTNNMSYAPVRADGYRTVGYFVNWGIYGRKFWVDDIIGAHWTHVLYSFFNLNAETGEIKITDPWADVDHRFGEGWNHNGSEDVWGLTLQLFKLKHLNRKMKIMASIGGWTYSQDGTIPRALDSPAKRERFAQTAADLVKNHGFDGIDLDWEYPNNDTEKANLVDTLRLAREKLNALGPGYELSVAAPCGLDKINNLDIPGMDQYLDFWNIMAYDFAGTWSTTAGHQANWFPSQQNPRSTEFSLQAALDRYSVVDPQKIVIGLPLYGRNFENTDGPGTPFSGTVEGSWEANVWDYKALPHSGATEHFDNQTVSAWSYNPAIRRMVTYDTPTSARHKAEMIKQRGYGGAMWWEMSGDKNTTEGSLVSNVISVFGGVDKLDKNQNHIDFSQGVTRSKFYNIREFPKHTVWEESGVPQGITNLPKVEKPT